MSDFFDFFFSWSGCSFLFSRKSRGFCIEMCSFVIDSDRRGEVGLWRAEKEREREKKNRQRERENRKLITLGDRPFKARVIRLDTAQSVICGWPKLIQTGPCQSCQKWSTWRKRKTRRGCGLVGQGSCCCCCCFKQKNFYVKHCTASFLAS